jgi:hypothetical protein
MKVAKPAAVVKVIKVAVPTLVITLCLSFIAVSAIFLLVLISKKKYNLVFLYDY